VVCCSNLICQVQQVLTRGMHPRITVRSTESIILSAETFTIVEISVHSTSEQLNVSPRCCGIIGVTRRHLTPQTRLSTGPTLSPCLSLPSSTQAHSPDAVVHGSKHRSSPDPAYCHSCNVHHVLFYIAVGITCPLAVAHRARFTLPPTPGAYPSTRCIASHTRICDTTSGPTVRESRCYGGRRISSTSVQELQPGPEKPVVALA